MKIINWLAFKKLTMNIIVFVFFSALISYISEILPDYLYYHKRWVFRERKWEENGNIYQRLLKVKKWKKFVPELSDFVKSVFPKKHINQFSKEYLSKFLVESCRSEFAHWSIIFSTFLFFLWNDFKPSVVMLLIAAALNLPYIIIQRYNRPRIIQILERIEHDTELCASYIYR